MSTVGNAPHPVVARLGPARRRSRLDPPGCHLRRPRARSRLGARRLRVDPRSAHRSADAGDRAARRPRRSARRAEHPGRPRRRPAAPVRLRPAGHARLARSIQGRRRGARDQGLRSSSPGSSGAPTTCSACPVANGASGSRSTGRSSCSWHTTSSRSACVAAARSPARRSVRCRASPSPSEREARRRTSWCSDCLNGCRLRRGTWGRRASPPRTNVSIAAQARSRSTPVPTDAPGGTTCRCIDRAVAAPPRRARLRHRRGSGTRSARRGGSRAWAR